MRRSVFALVAPLIVAAGALGFEAIMRLQRWLTYVTVVVTVAYVAFTVDELDWTKMSDLPQNLGLDAARGR